MVGVSWSDGLSSCHFSLGVSFLETTGKCWMYEEDFPMLTMGLLTMTSVDADRVLPDLRVHRFLFLPRSRQHHLRVTRLAVQAHIGRY